jgi:Arc/MetJ family transcription regulator
MRTNIEIDDELMARAMRLSGLPTKKAVVEEALRTLVRLRDQARIRELRGKIEWEGDLDAWRRDIEDDRK